MAASLSCRSSASLKTFASGTSPLDHKLQSGVHSWSTFSCSQNARGHACTAHETLLGLRNGTLSRIRGRHCLRTVRRRQASVRANANACETGDAQTENIPPGSVSVVLLAGGVGKRMGAPMPKQYLPLHGQPIALYSLALFASLGEVGEIIVVCDPSYRQLFEDAVQGSGRSLQWASPGKERQDSVFNGLQEVRPSAELVCVHDSARPLLTREDALHVFRDALQYGAAVLGVPVKQTIKEAKLGGFVERTLDRSKLWEMQTPQVIKPDLLARGFEHVRREGLEVTDDVSIVEYLNAPVKITQGSYTNLKVTTPEDLLLAEKLILEAEEQQAAQKLGSGVQAVHVSNLTLQQV